MLFRRGKIQLILQRLQAKKNLILQGPPGTGKTWLARRLAYCLMGEETSSASAPCSFTLPSPTKILFAAGVLTMKVV
ncbi:nSTAND3 domain-containing NTPase [Enterobacter hormaechei]